MPVIETTVEDGKYYWVRAPLRRRTADGNGWEDAGLGYWQPAQFNACPPDLDTWVLLGDNTIYQSSPDFDRVVVHPVPMEPPHD